MKWKPLADERGALLVRKVVTITSTAMVAEPVAIAKGDWKIGNGPATKLPPPKCNAQADLVNAGLDSLS